LTQKSVKIWFFRKKSRNPFDSRVGKIVCIDPTNTKRKSMTAARDRIGHSNASKRINRPIKKERTPRMTDADWSSIKNGAQANGQPTGDYLVSLHNERRRTSDNSPAKTVALAALNRAVTEITHLVATIDSAQDADFELLLEVHAIMTCLIEPQ
jgi:hypothetical protein